MVDLPSERRLRCIAGRDSGHAEPQIRLWDLSQQRCRSPVGRRSPVCRRTRTTRIPSSTTRMPRRLPSVTGGLRFFSTSSWLAIAAASTVLLLRAIGTLGWRLPSASSVYPLLLTGAWYLAGYSMLAAVSLAPLIAWLWIRGSFALAGGLLCVGLLFKLNLALVLISAPVAFLLLGVPAGPARSQAARGGSRLRRRPRSGRCHPHPPRRAVRVSRDRDRHRRLLSAMSS